MHPSGIDPDPSPDLERPLIRRLWAPALGCNLVLRAYKARVLTVTLPAQKFSILLIAFTMAAFGGPAPIRTEDSPVMSGES